MSSGKLHRCDCAARSARRPRRPDRVGTADAQAGLPASGSGPAFPARRVARQHQWLLGSGCGNSRGPFTAARPRRNLTALPEPGSVRPNGPFRTAPHPDLPQPTRLRTPARGQCSGPPGQGPGTFVDTGAGVGVDLRLFPGIPEGDGRVAHHRDSVDPGGTPPSALPMPRPAAWPGDHCQRLPRAQAHRTEVQTCPSRTARS